MIYTACSNVFVLDYWLKSRRAQTGGRFALVLYLIPTELEASWDLAG